MLIIMKAAKYRRHVTRIPRSKNFFFKSAGNNSRNGQPASFFEKAPAWSIGGSVYLGAGFFAANPDKQKEILQHESVHALHQQSAPIDNSNAARNHAENIATNPGLADANALSVAAPEMLAFPPQTYDGWSQVHLGAENLFGEIVDSGITLRIAISYNELGIAEVTKKDSIGDMEMDMIVKSKSAVYHCGPHPFKPIAPYIDRLKKVAAVVKKVNAKIPAGSMWKTDLVVMAPNTNEAFRIANGKGLLELDSNNININFILDSVAHETSHGVFEHHAAAGDTDQYKRVPDNFALSIADLYVQLQNTKDVSIPTKKFDPDIVLASSSGGKPAGLVMVMDMLWSGSGGHPWDGVDEFFASAYGAYIQNQSLLKKIIDRYAAYDPAIKPLKAVLLNLLQMTGDTKKIASLKAPADATGATKVLSYIKQVPDHTSAAPGLLSQLIDTSTVVGPKHIKCN